MQDGACAHLQHGLQDHGVALHNLAQRNELRVGAQEVQRTSAGRTRSRRWLRKTHLLMSEFTHCSQNLRCLAIHAGGMHGKGFTLPSPCRGSCHLQPMPTLPCKPPGA